jgi:hypothetical protein
LKPKTLQIAISLVALVIGLVHVVWPTLTIDAITVILILIAILPWLGPIFKSVELPGGVKVEFQDLEKTTEKAERVGLLAPTSPAAPGPQYSFQQVASIDPIWP